MPLCCPSAAHSVIDSTETLIVEFLLISVLRLRLHEEWLEKERLAQEVFRLKFEREDAARKRKEEEEVREHVEFKKPYRHFVNIESMKVFVFFIFFFIYLCNFYFTKEVLA